MAYQPAQQVPPEVYQQQPAMHPQQFAVQQASHQQQWQHQQHPQPSDVQAQNVTSREWQNSLMDCGPCESCLLGTCLPCILLGRTSERIRDPSMQTYDSFNSDCLIMCGISYFGCGWIYAMIKRGEIRKRFGIDGDGMGDCCTAYWCGCCALIQQDKEVAARTASAPVMTGYQPNKDGMVMPQPQGGK